MHSAAHLKHVLPQRHGGIGVEDPAQVHLHPHHEGRGQREARAFFRTTLGVGQPRGQQARQDDEQHGHTVPEGVILLLQGDALVALQGRDRRVRRGALLLATCAPLSVCALPGPWPQRLCLCSWCLLLMTPQLIGMSFLCYACYQHMVWTQQVPEP